MKHVPLRLAAVLVVACSLSLRAPAAADDTGERFATPFIGAIEASLAGDQGMDLALDAIRGVPDAALPAFGAWFEANAHRMPPVYIFSYANRIFATDRPRGVQWFFAGRTRLLYDAFRCRDDTVFEQVAEVDAVFQDIVGFARANPAEGAAAGTRALEWDSSHNVVERPEALLQFCLTGIKGKRLAIEQGKPTTTSDAQGDRPAAFHVGLPDVKDPSGWVVPKSEYPTARGQAFDVTRRVIEQLKSAAQ